MLESLKQTMALRAMGLFKIPMIFFLSPSIVELNKQRAIIKIPLTYRSKNHLGSMYFGALAVGADLAGGLIAADLIRKSGKNVALVFKDMKADFLKRPESDVHFTCSDGPAIEDLVQKAIQTKERQNLTFDVIATCPKTFGTQPVAKFSLTLSLKLK